MDYMNALVTASEVKINANHLKFVDDNTINTVIDEVHISFIAQYLPRFASNQIMLGKLKLIEKLLTQHMLTLNVRRADSESIPGMSKSISVPKDQDLDQTEYGQMARKLAEKIPLDWANDDKPASLVIY